ncbi:hypothetical protein EJ08DRAFT_644413 [Tothia fuscella]|uniref:HypA n=1 Tax=Tothia fuscella TaxID=1048955 RepID=A0A9P4U4L9_9PEZI|nr:hypothetical protein EJ08DRAFT_644413 [Tothia fuscella]
MATPSNIHLNPSHKSSFQLPSLSQESAKTASQLLQQNHDNHHIFFNSSGFHNHIAHHILTIYALGASPSTLQKQYDANANYQRPPGKVEEKIVKEMKDPEVFRKYLGDEKYYNDYLVFFQGEMEEKGWESVVNEVLFKGDERGDDVLVRLFSGFLHPIIHLGFGIEFAQPGIIAEALAQAACHSNWIKPLYLDSEKAAKKSQKEATPSKPIIDLLNEIRSDSKLTNSPHWDDSNKIRDGILARAPQEMIKYASQYHINDPSSDLVRETAEMIEACTYYTAGAQHPPKQTMFDFYFMHCVNSSIFFPAFLKQDWLSQENKVRLLEWKVRTDLAMYASRRSPKILKEEISGFKGKKEDSWENIFERVRELPDDGHASKLVRAVAHGKQYCQKFEGEKGFVFNGESWDKLGNMVIESVEATGSNWVRSAGFDEAWVDYKDRPLAVL